MSATIARQARRRASRSGQRGVRARHGRRLREHSGGATPHPLELETVASASAAVPSRGARPERTSGTPKPVVYEL